MQEFKAEIIAPTGDCAVLQLTGELDAYTAPLVRDRIRELADGGVVHVIADMSRVDFLDSTGLGVLIGGLKRLREHDGSLAPVIIKSGVLKVLQITGLTGVLPPQSSVADAIDASPHWRQVVETESGSTAEWCKKHDLG
jgi:anti-sigma B factor antagonist